MYIYFGFFLFNDRMYTPVVTTTMPAMKTTTTIYCAYNSIRFRYFSSCVLLFFYFSIILVVLVTAKLFLPIIFFVNWLGSHAARVSRRLRRRRNELADRLPPPPRSPQSQPSLPSELSYTVLPPFF